MSLGNLAFVAEPANVILLGPSGVGKTHLAVALGLQGVYAMDQPVLPARSLREKRKPQPSPPANHPRLDGDPKPVVYVVGDLLTRRKMRGVVP